jgi:transposase
MKTALLSAPAAPAGPVEPVVGDIERFLEQVLADLEPAPQAVGRGRPRVLPALCLWAGLLVCVLRGFSSQLALWRLLSVHGLWRYPRFALSDQAVYNRLARAGTAPLEQLFTQLSALLARRLAPYADQGLAPFASAVVALDETTLDRVARTLPALRGAARGAPALLPGKLAGIFDLRRQQWQHLEHVPNPRQNEKLAAWHLLEQLAPGSLVLADLGYYGFAWFDALTERGHWWLSRQRAKGSLVVEHVYYQRGAIFDGLVWLGAYRADRAAHLVRLVRFPVGATSYQYLTNVLDPGVLSLGEIARLYPRRWDIELAFKLVKQQLGLHLFWSAKPVVVLQQVWAVLCIAQILQALRLEVAGRAGVEPFEVSLPLLVQHLPQFAEAGGDPLEQFVRLGRQAGFIRPSRRMRVHAPEILLAELSLPPPGLALTRRARHSLPHSGPHKSPTRRDLKKVTH